MTGREEPAVPEVRLELAPVPVSDAGRAKDFYAKAGSGNLHDTQVTDTMRVVRYCPKGAPAGPAPRPQAGARPWFLTASIATAAASGSRYSPPFFTGRSDASSS